MKQLFIILTVWAAAYSTGRAQTIATIAGGGMAEDRDGIAATAAPLHNPYGIAADGNGTVYFADRNSNTIKKIATNGTVSTLAGNGKAGYSGDGKAAVRAQLNYPIAVALDGSGSLLFSDRRNNCVRKINMQAGGIITTIAGTGKAGYSGEGGPATDAQLNGPAGIWVDQYGSIFICDAYNHSIRKISPTGIIASVAGTGTRGASGDGGPATLAELNEPYGITGDEAGNIYFTEYGNNRVRKITASGTIVTMAGNGTRGYSGDHGPATLAQLNRPTCLVADKNGALVVTDGENNCVRKIDIDGTICTIAGTGVAGYWGDGGAATNANLSGPAGVTLDPAGNILITDLGNNRIRMITPLAMVKRSGEMEIEFEIVPNTVNMTLEFKFNAPLDGIVKVLDMEGNVKEARNVRHETTVAFDVKTYAAGFYMYEVQTGGKTRKGKFRID